MTGNQIINQIGFDRATSISHTESESSDGRALVLGHFNDLKFDIDSVYFNSDDDGNSFPAVFLKKVESFETQTLKSIAETHQKLWNYKKVLFFYVYSDTEIRIYNCSERPLTKIQGNINYSKELKRIEIESFEYSDKLQIKRLNSLFSRVAIDSGIIWTHEEAKSVRDQIRLQRRVDKYLVESLVNTANKLEDQGLDINYIHKVILRSLFLLYLEDRGATDAKLYSQIKSGTRSYFDILEDPGATKKLFQRLEEDFNGNVFTIEDDEHITSQQLALIQKCFRIGNDNTDQATLFENWRLFDFSIIQIELLSEIYETFLFRTDPELKKNTGTYYTPPSLVEFILNEKLPTSETYKNYNTKVLDPSCGSGIFLVESFNRLVKRHENEHKKRLTDFNKLKSLLTDNIYGVELNSQAIKVAAFSLYLALVDKLDPKNLWQKKKHRLPNLINNPKDPSIINQGQNLFCRDTILSNVEIEDIRFDLVVGNPPFGTSNLSESIRAYCEEYDFAKEMVLPFLHKAVSLAPNGEIALIFNTKVLTNTNSKYQNFRRWMFNECYVEKVFNFSILRKAPKNFGGQLFGDATGPVSIVYYKKNPPATPSDKIQYYAPKTYIKSNIIDGLSIDFTDLKFLPREECKKSDSKIWKVAMWGGMNDWNLLNKVFDRSQSLKSYFSDKNNKWNKPRVGLNGDKQKQDFIPEKVIDAKLIERYYTPVSASKDNSKIFRKIDKSIFNPPFVIMKKGQHKKLLAASYIDYFSYCTTACYIFNGSVNSDIKKALVAILNSNFTSYLLFLTGASWGIEREQVFMDEILESPALLPLLKPKTVVTIVAAINEILSLRKSNKFFNSLEIEEIEKTASKCISNDILQSSSKEAQIVSDTIEYSLDLFEKQGKSTALLSCQVDQTNKYAEILCQEINAFLEGQSIFANGTVYNVGRSTPLMMLKISFGKSMVKVFKSDADIDLELKKMDKALWEKKATNIYFRKKLNYKDGNDIYIIRPNQRRFWSQSMAMEDASELILEILNEI